MDYGTIKIDRNGSVEMPCRVYYDLRPQPIDGFTRSLQRESIVVFVSNLATAEVGTPITVLVRLPKHASFEARCMRLQGFLKAARHEAGGQLWVVSVSVRKIITDPDPLPVGNPPETPALLQ